MRDDGQGTAMTVALIYKTTEEGQVIVGCIRIVGGRSCCSTRCGPWAPRGLPHD
jgi:hypothetical protein